MPKLDLATITSAGVMAIAVLATLAGVYQLAKPSPRTAIMEPNRTPPAPPVAEVDRRQPQKPAVMAGRHREQADAEARQVIEHHRQQMQGKVKCVGGVLFAIESNAWTNVGTC